jgi:hypothetical protein
MQHVLRTICRKQECRTFVPCFDLLCHARAADDDLVVKLNHLSVILGSPDSRAKPLDEMLSATQMQSVPAGYKRAIHLLPSVLVPDTLSALKRSAIPIENFVEIGRGQVISPSSLSWQGSDGSLLAQVLRRTAL